ncbi:MAG: DEAD/DEAH box helicase, partial [Limisphaerales bacterium]
MAQRAKRRPTPAKRVAEVFFARGWKPFKFQREAWKAYANEESGLVHAPTGTGKTYAVWAPTLIEWLEEKGEGVKKAPGLRVLWITPLRALVQDTTRALSDLVGELEIPWTIQARTGDTSSSVKAKQRRCYPTALVTTPESLSLLLSYPETREQFADLKVVIVDEWHELLSTKRGVQTELGLARLRQWNRGLKTWGLSATLGNLDEALACLVGSGNEGRLINGDLKKKFVVKTLIPKAIDRLPWSGHLGSRMVKEVVKAIEQAKTTLVFTNVRSQTEFWFHAIKEERPDWEGEIGIHHGSLDRADRGEVEDRLRTGTIKAVVCTSSLDLGVDFTPVEQVIQIGGPKGVARLLQRAGRCGHQPGAVSKVICVPTQAMEMVEYAAAREAIDARRMEAREPIRAPLDLLSQHLVTIALGEAFERDAMLAEVRTAWSYRHLTDEEWQWTIDFVVRGGSALRAYDQFRRVIEKEDQFTVESKPIAKFHRMSIGTITSDQSMFVKYLSGKSLGTIEESFIAKVRPGANFVFGGQTLTLVRVREMTAWVRKGKGGRGAVPVWGGGRSPLSSELANGV